MGGALSSKKNSKQSSSSTTATTSTSSSSSSSSSQTKSTSSQTLSGLGNLIKLLPTGTVFLFEFMNPVVSDNGQCSKTVNKILTAILLVICAFNCCFACFTDSYTGSDDQRHYGIVTGKGIWPAPASEKVDMNKYKLRVGDFVHAVLGLLVFAVLGLLDSNTVRCFYSGFESTGKTLLQAAPPVIGVAASVVFVVFPNTRHGIGYPYSSDSSSSSTSSTSTTDENNNKNKGKGKRVAGV